MATENGTPVEVERMEFEGVKYKAVKTERHPCLSCQAGEFCGKVKCPSFGMSWIEEEPDEHSVKQPHSENIRDYNVGNSDYAKHKIQPWDIWLEYRPNPWEADIIKRVLRKKEGQSRREDFEKIIHIAHELIRQIDAGEYQQ